MDLFEDILGQIGAEFLSDIKSEQFRDSAIKCALNIENEKYPRSEWLDLMKYLTPYDASKDMNIEQIKSSLENMLKTSNYKKKRFQVFRI